MQTPYEGKVTTRVDLLTQKIISEADAGLSCRVHNSATISGTTNKFLLFTKKGYLSCDDDANNPLSLNRITLGDISS